MVAPDITVVCAPSKLDDIGCKGASEGRLRVNVLGDCVIDLSQVLFA